MAGRKPLGPALVEYLDGSEQAKARLKLILATNAGQISVVDAARELGISEAMFYQLRSRVLQVSLEDLEPKPAGRPPQVASADATQIAELTARVADLERELAAQAVRLELAQALPHVVQPASSPALKKTNRQTLLKQKLRDRRAPRKRQ